MPINYVNTLQFFNDHPDTINGRLVRAGDQHDAKLHEYTFKNGKVKYLLSWRERSRYFFREYKTRGCAEFNFNTLVNLRNTMTTIQTERMRKNKQRQKKG